MIGRNDNSNDQKWNKKYHIVRTVGKSQKESKSIPLTHKYMTAHNPGSVHANEIWQIRVITKLPNSEQSYKGKSKLIII